jgi:citrate lyase beta subunit
MKMSEIKNRKVKLNNRHPLRRSVLFMPGDSLRKISKAAHMEVDCIVMDLEDGVALNRKAEARQVVSEALTTLDFGRSERLVRLNPPAVAEGRLFTADFAETIAARPDGYVIPKVETAQEVQTVSRQLAEAENTHGWPLGTIRLLAVVETAKGIMNLGEIAQASQRLQALMFGAEDLAGDIGAIRSRANWEVFYARSAVVTAAAAYGLEALDMILTDFNDVDRLEEEATFARQMGYRGKMLIHPGQVEVVNRVFAPSAAEIAHARRLVTAHTANQAAGAGAFALDGKMVDMPLVRAAEHILEKARLAGLLEDNL